MSFVFGCTVLGCQQSDEAIPKVEFCSTVNLYGTELTSESHPVEVAAIALAAIENDDIDALVKLVAAKKVFADVMEITDGDLAFRRSADDAPRITAEVVASRIKSLQPDTRTIEGETIHGDSATVVIMGICDGAIQKRTLYFAREDDLWKLVPSRRSTKGVRYHFGSRGY